LLYILAQVVQAGIRIDKLKSGQGYYEYKW